MVFRCVRALLVAALVLVLTACAGSPSSSSGWADTTDKTIGQAVSSLGTARIVLVAHRHHQVLHTYAVGALGDAIEVADKEIGKYAGVQPPDDQHHLAEDVVGALHDAEGLLVRIRTTYASPAVGDAEVVELLRQIDDELENLDRLTTRVDGATS